MINNTTILNLSFWFLVILEKQLVEIFASLKKKKDNLFPVGLLAQSLEHCTVKATYKPKSQAFFSQLQTSRLHVYMKLRYQFFHLYLHPTVPTYELIFTYLIF